MSLRNQTLSVICSTILAGSLLTPSIAQADALQQQKLDFIQQQFNQSSKHSSYWQNGWLGFFWGSGVLQALGASDAEDDKPDDEYDMTVGAITSVLGATDMLFNPMETHHYAWQLQQMPQQNEQQLTEKLAKAESWLALAAEREAYERSWTNRLLSMTVNALAGAAIAFDDDRESDGWITFATGTLVSEIKIWTAPNNLTSAYLNYQNGNYQVQKNVPIQNWKIASAGPSVTVEWRF